MGVPILSIILKCITCGQEMSPEATEKSVDNNNFTFTIFQCSGCKYKVLVKATSLLRIEI